MASDCFDLDGFLDLPRVAGLAVSPDGRRLVTTVSRRNPKGTAFTTALWQLDPDGEAAPVRLTRSAKGEGAPQFLPNGDLLFRSARPDPDRKDDDQAEADALWLLPAAGGEARLVTAPPGGISGLAVARKAGTIVLAAQAHPGTDDWEADREREQARRDAGVTALLFEDYPMRYWDRYLGPMQRRLSVMAGPDADPRCLTPEPRQALLEVPFDVTPDGRTVVTGWWRDAADPRERVMDLVAIDVASGERRTLVEDADSIGGVACAPDGRRVACIHESRATPDEPPAVTVLVVDLTSREARRCGQDLDRWPSSLLWAPDGALYCTADDRGHALVFRLAPDGGPTVRLVADGAHEALCAAGGKLFALRSSVVAMPRAVRLDGDAADQSPLLLPTPGDDVPVPGRVERVTVAADDGTEVGAWLVLPADSGQPAPLALWIHGGPLASWNSWHWRWNPHVFAARGWAVLLPDPALSTGYGQDFIRRGWGAWGQAPYTDLMAVIDAVVQRPDIDESKTAALGGSFGGYMANWVAGHTDRFKAIVTHASLWNLRAFHGTTDLGVWWEQQFGDPYVDPERYEASSPHHHVAKVRTPMLVIHGQRDERVPVGEGLALWTDLKRHGVETSFLYFPDEHHWIEKPQHARIWYATVLAFCEHHVLGTPWQRPDLL